MCPINEKIKNTLAVARFIAICCVWFVNENDVCRWMACIYDIVTDSNVFDTTAEAFGHLGESCVRFWNTLTQQQPQQKHRLKCPTKLTAKTAEIIILFYGMLWRVDDTLNQQQHVYEVAYAHECARDCCCWLCVNGISTICCLRKSYAINGLLLYLQIAHIDRTRTRIQTNSKIKCI